jgi:hypothetical protein
MRAPVTLIATTSSVSVRGTTIMPNPVATEYHESRPGLPKPVAVVVGSSAPDRRRVGRFEKEDIAIIFLSAVLVIATLLLAIRVL